MLDFILAIVACLMAVFLGLALVSIIKGDSWRDR